MRERMDDADVATWISLDAGDNVGGTLWRFGVEVIEVHVPGNETKLSPYSS
ncbi:MULTISPECIES: hypothetical protein [unclassified Paenibacillus]|uniref:hypothetical protein n=1 Tax=unclassified Paenibacillus TaxID=185978 RepID=UPI00362AF913